MLDNLPRRCYDSNSRKYQNRTTYYLNSTCQSAALFLYANPSKTSPERPDYPPQQPPQAAARFFLSFSFPLAPFSFSLFFAPSPPNRSRVLVLRLSRRRRGKASPTRGKDKERNNRSACCSLRAVGEGASRFVGALWRQSRARDL